MLTFLIRQQRPFEMRNSYSTEVSNEYNYVHSANEKHRRSSPEDVFCQHFKDHVFRVSVAMLFI